MGTAQRRQHRLRHRDLGEHVHVELLAHFLGRDDLQRATDADARVVDESIESRRGASVLCGQLLHPRRGVRYLGCIRHVEGERDHPSVGSRLAGQLLARGAVAHAGEDRPATPRETQRGRAADARRGSRDQRDRHDARLAESPETHPGRPWRVSARLGCRAMLARLQRTLPATRVLAALVLLATLGGCGTGGRGGSSSPTAAVAGAGPHRTCPETVLDVLVRVAKRIYHQGLSRERTRSAAHLVAASAGLREGVERGDAAITRAAAMALVAGGHMTNLRVKDATGRVLADVGGAAVTPLPGTLQRAGGRPIGSYLTSVWSDEGLIAETNGVTGGRLALRVNGRSVGGSLALAPGPLPREGTLTHDGQR